MIAGWVAVKINKTAPESMIKRDGRGGRANASPAYDSR